jgi:tetratricopeptide (TPR) repeat protein
MEADESLADRYDFARNDYRVLIALREDYLAHLEALRELMPSITQNRLRLTRMNSEQAMQAVLQPGGALVSRDAAEAIVRFVSGGVELAHAEVEPALLSLICRELNNARIAQGHATVSADLLAGSQATILSEFYERALADQPASVRRVIEDALLTEAGFRENVAEERLRRAIEAAGGQPATLDLLVERRLLRIEERLDVRRVELTHDVLCSVVAASARLRREREAREESERRLAQESELAARTGRQLRRTRMVAAICILLALGAVAGGAYGYYSATQAESARRQTAATRAQSEQARGEAESLISFLLDDFQSELQPLGRLNLLRSIAERTVRYYEGLPPETRTTDSRRNLALAKVHLGETLTLLNHTNEAGAVLKEAVEMLAALRKAGDQSEATLVGLALGRRDQAELELLRLNTAEAARIGRLAVDTLGDAAETTQVTLARARATLALGHAQYKVGRWQEAAASLRQSRSLLRPFTDPALERTAAATDFVVATGWLVGALGWLGEFHEAQALANETLPLAGDLVQRHPLRLDVLSARSKLVGVLLESVGMRGEMEPDAIIRLAGMAEADDKRMVELDRRNGGSLMGLMISRQFVGSGLYYRGDVRKALAQLWYATEWPQEVPRNEYTLLNLRAIYRDLAQWAYETGDSEQGRKAEVAERNLQEHRRTRDEWSRQLAAWDGEVTSAFLLLPQRKERQLAHSMQDLLSRMREHAKGGDKYKLNEYIGYVQLMLATASLRMENYAQSEAAAKEALRLIADSSTRRELASLQTGLAVALARQGKREEAARQLAPAQALMRELEPKLGNDQLLRIEYAGVLYAQALAEPARAQELLQQSLRKLDQLVPELRNSTTAKLWRQWAQEALKENGDRT